MREMLKKHMIRRKMNGVNYSASLIPESHDKVVFLEFSKPERALYDYLEKILARESMRKDQPYLARGSACFIIYLRLKQVCVDHWILLDKFPDLIPMAKTDEDQDLLSALINENEEYPKERSYYDSCSEYQGALDIIRSY